MKINCILNFFTYISCTGQAIFVVVEIKKVDIYLKDLIAHITK